MMDETIFNGRRTFRGLLILLIISIILPASASEASEYAFGSKVLPQDRDLGSVLKNMPDGTMVSFWDIGTNVGIYDGDDVVYLDTPPVGIVNANDLRLVPFKGFMAGSKVVPDDKDMNSPLLPLSAEMRFLNTNSDQSYDLNDPVYLHQSYSTSLEISVPLDDSMLLDDSMPLGTDPGAYLDQPAAQTPPVEEPAAVSDISNDAANVASIENATSNAGCGQTGGGDPGPGNGFWERLPYSGSCTDLPLGSMCLVFSDGFRWLVSDYCLDCRPVVVGFYNSLPIEVISCDYADYYHILQTYYVSSVSKQQKLYVQSAPYTNSADRLLEAVDQIGQSLDPTRTNDIRLTPVGEMAAGTRISNLDPDLNKVVAQPVLASFPTASDDYAGLRVHDVNGNGLYDYPDIVYLDISFPGYSPFGMVSVNDVRLSGPARFAEGTAQESSTG